MIKELKSLWIEDLESDEYKQARGYLSNGDGYCCLGVLLHRTFPRSGIVIKDDYGFVITEASGRDGEELSPVFREAIDLDAGNMSILISMNDGGDLITTTRPQTFAEIAQWLRDHKEV